MNMKQSIAVLHRIFSIAVLFTCCALSGIGYCQTNRPVTNSATPIIPAYPSDYSQRASDISSLREKVDQLAMQVEYEQKVSAVRNETILKMTDRSLSILAGFGAIAGLLGAISIVLGWYRDKQQHADYESERKFYEERVKASDAREARLMGQQLEMGDNAVARSAEMLTKQIDGITKIGGVIGLIEQTYQHQQKIEEDRNKDAQNMQNYRKMIEHYLASDRRKYEHAAASILSFKDYKAMQWTRLTDQERKLAERARNLFENIPDFIIQEQLTAETTKSRLARISQLFGVSAFYAKDVESAIEHLEKAKSIYSEMTFQPEDVYSRAYTNFFIGLIEKNWRSEDRAPVANLQEAKRHLGMAWDLVKIEKGQFLIPITLAEIESYIDSERDAAGKLLDDDIIPRLEGLRDSKSGLDENQSSLLLRSYLIRGNIAFKANKQSEALVWYEKGTAYDENKTSAYPMLSAALASNSDISVWRNCLEVLEKSGALMKFEETVRVTALAWAAIAAHYSADKVKKDYYLKELNGIGLEIRPLGKRVPLFFCPIQKIMVEFKALMEQINGLQ
jgi:hypothetical protein